MRARILPPDALGLDAVGKLVLPLEYTEPHTQNAVLFVQDPDQCIPSGDARAALRELEAPPGGVFVYCVSRLNPQGRRALLEAGGIRSTPTLMAFRGQYPVCATSALAAYEGADLKDAIHRFLSRGEEEPEPGPEPEGGVYWGKP